MGLAVPAAWISGSDSAALLQFYEGYDFQGIARARVVTNPSLHLRQLGIYVVPTTYLLDRQGRLVVGLLEGRLPPVELAKQVCSNSS